MPGPPDLSKLTAGRLAALGVVLLVIGNEVSIPIPRNLLEILAGVVAVVGLILD